jgi:hypothetical protein
VYQNILQEVNYTINDTINFNLDEYINWVIEIKQIDAKDNSAVINPRLINKIYNNVGFRFISFSNNDTPFNESYIKLSLLDTMFKNINYNKAFIYLRNHKMFIYHDIYFLFIIVEYNDITVNPNNDTFMEKLYTVILDEANTVYNEPVDNIGDKLYYLQKNLKSVIFKRKSSLLQYAIDELNYNIYKYSENIEETIKNYDNNEIESFDVLKKFFNDNKNRKKFDVNTTFPE